MKTIFSKMHKTSFYNNQDNAVTPLFYDRQFLQPINVSQLMLSLDRRKMTVVYPSWLFPLQRPACPPPARSHTRARAGGHARAAASSSIHITKA